MAHYVSLPIMELDTIADKKLTHFALVINGLNLDVLYLKFSILIHCAQPRAAAAHSCGLGRAARAVSGSKHSGSLGHVAVPVVAGCSAAVCLGS